MILGLVLKAYNAIYFKNQLDLHYMFLPMIVFTSCLFVYMVLLIVVKWSISWNTRMLLATCIDPNNDPSWNTSLYDDWKLCDQSIGDGTCTPVGFRYGCLIQYGWFWEVAYMLLTVSLPNCFYSANWLVGPFLLREWHNCHEMSFWLWWFRWWMPTTEPGEHFDNDGVETWKCRRTDVPRTTLASNPTGFHCVSFHPDVVV